MIHSITHWNLARRPNYKTNVDKLYPYSEVPYIGNYYLVRLPVTPETTIDHVDYWGEGRISVKEGSSGFPDCYNVNHQYQLVSNGPDTDKKIPNRIPVISYTNCDTSGYIKDDSVKLVTVMGAPINKSCARDIARMVNKDIGKVVVYGFSETSADIKNLTDELAKKYMLFVPSFALTEYLKGLTLFDSHRAYLNIKDLSDVFNNNVIDGVYDNAVAIFKVLKQYNKTNVIDDIVDKLLKEGKKNVVTFAYKLWAENEKDIVENNFPNEFKLIFGGSEVKIINKKYNVGMNLHDEINNPSEKVAYVENNVNNIRWKFETIYENNEIFFKIKSVDFNVYLKIENSIFNAVNEKAKIGSNAGETKFLWILKPLKINSDLVFFIINRQTNQGLKLDESAIPGGAKQLFAYEMSTNDQPENFGWLLAPTD